MAKPDRLVGKRGRKTLYRLSRLLKRVLNPPLIHVDELVLGQNIVIEPGVEIESDRLVLGDGVVIKSGTRIEHVDLVIGDYTKINNNCLITGTNFCRIGHNCWFGHYTIIDSIGSTRIGNGVGVGAHSQLWTHSYFGDVLEGSRFASQRPLLIEDDVWFVGHCIVSPIHAHRRSMALVGSVITKDMEENHVYGGVPAEDMTEKLGPQFTDVDVSVKRDKMQEYLEEFVILHAPEKNRIRIVDRLDLDKLDVSQFSVTERLYIKNNYPEEQEFMRFLLPTKAKFLPHESGDWIASYLSSN